MSVYLFSLRAMVLVLSVTFVCGCRPTAAPFEGRSMKQVPPGEFFTDPLQVRLAVAVDAGDAAAVEAAVRDGADSLIGVRDRGTFTFVARGLDEDL